ncbi:Uncharacterised protein [Kingella potus]|uniref:Lipoprotein n=1 Tax=Kingella potus TaxID=265175 RepID=A0A377R0Z2_9NEIS|nr:hypothetical protein [Kingella potus]UOP01702.1 hypothetical protein LVJ84_06145 [Kingella potus]STQ99991.1 Uncharacterised protein [Kingella potus]
MNKPAALLLPAAVLALAGCHSTSSVKYAKKDDLANIRKVCIIRNDSARPSELDRHFAAALAKRGITSETVAGYDKKLYQPECPYNLRFKSGGNDDTIRTASLLLRTPEYAVGAVKYSLNDEKDYRTSPNLQQQADGIIARLLGEKAK